MAATLRHIDPTRPPSILARYKASHQADDLSTGWRRLQDRYPASLWRVKQAFIEQPAEAEYQSARAQRKVA